MHKSTPVDHKDLGGPGRVYSQFITRETEAQEGEFTCPQISILVYLLFWHNFTETLQRWSKDFPYIPPLLPSYIAIVPWSKLRS
jgi:hypothetical protein